LARSAICNVLSLVWDQDWPAKDRGRDLPHGLRSGSTADQDYSLDRNALFDHGVHPVGQTTEQALDRRASDIRR
jgi:hypothetical protein